MRQEILLADIETVHLLGTVGRVFSIRIVTILFYEKCEIVLRVRNLQIYTKTIRQLSLELIVSLGLIV